MGDKPVSVSIPAGGPWTAITAAGQSGTVWMGQNPSSGRVVIAHSDGGIGTLDKDISYQIPNINNDESTDIVPISADNASDVFYAFSTLEVAKLNVDVS